MGYSGLWNGEYNEDYSLLVNKSPLQKRIARVFRRGGLRTFQELALTLNGAAAGSTAAATHSRAEAERELGSPTVNGGARTIETVTHVNRVTTAADKTAIDAVLSQSTAPTYPTDASGNGGGGKLGLI